MVYYLVEHESRGIFVEMKNGKPRFSYTILRSAGYHFGTQKAAAKIVELVPKSYILKVTLGKPTEVIRIP